MSVAREESVPNIMTGQFVPENAVSEVLAQLDPIMLVGTDALN